MNEYVITWDIEVLQVKRLAIIANGHLLQDPKVIEIDSLIKEKKSELDKINLSQSNLRSKDLEKQQNKFATEMKLLTEKIRSGLIFKENTFSKEFTNEEVFQKFMNLVLVVEDFVIKLELGTGKIEVKKMFEQNCYILTFKMHDYFEADSCLLFKLESSFEAFLKSVVVRNARYCPGVTQGPHDSIGESIPYEAEKIIKDIFKYFVFNILDKYKEE